MFNMDWRMLAQGSVEYADSAALFLSVLSLQQYAMLREPDADADQKDVSLLSLLPGCPEHGVHLSQSLEPLSRGAALTLCEKRVG